MTVPLCENRLSLRSLNLFSIAVLIIWNPAFQLIFRIHEFWIPYALIINQWGNVQPVWAISFINIALHRFKFGNNTKPVAQEAITECVLVTFFSVVCFFAYIQDDSIADGTYNTQVHMYIAATMNSEIAVNDQQGSGLYEDGKQDHEVPWWGKPGNTVRSKSERMKSDNQLWLSQETARKL